jgi:hypothetical protein
MKCKNCGREIHLFSELDGTRFYAHLPTELVVCRNALAAEDITRPMKDQDGNDLIATPEAE